MSYISIKPNATYSDSMRFIKKLALDGSQNHQIKQFAKEALMSSNPLKKVFEIAYNSAVYVPNPDEEQNLQPVFVTLRDKIANCVNYSVLIGAILTAMNYPYQFKIVDFTRTFEGFKHIYVICKNVVLDCVIGQDETGKATFATRNKQGQYNKEVNHTFSKTYAMPALNIMQGIEKVKPLIIVNGSRGRAGRIGFKQAHEKSLNWFGSNFIDSVGDTLASIDPTNPNTGVGSIISNYSSQIAQLDPTNPNSNIGKMIESVSDRFTELDFTNKDSFIGGLFNKAVGLVLPDKKTIPVGTTGNSSIVPIIIGVGALGAVAYVLTRKKSRR